MRGARGIFIATTIACLLAVACAPGPAQAVRNVEEDREAVIDAHLALKLAYEAGDVEAFAAGLDPSPDLLIFHPKVLSRFDGIDEVRGEMARMFGRIGQTVWSDVHQAVVVEGDTAWLTGQVVIESPVLDPPFVGRSTEIFVRREEGWRLVHAHWSPLPQ